MIFEDNEDELYDEFDASSDGDSGSECYPMDPTVKRNLSLAPKVGTFYVSQSSIDTSVSSKYLTLNIYHMVNDTITIV